MEEGLKVLMVISYGEKAGESYRVTLNSSNINLCLSPESMIQRQGMNLCRADVKFVDGGSFELYVSRNDLEKIEEAIGFYGVEEIGGIV